MNKLSDAATADLSGQNETLEKQEPLFDFAKLMSLIERIEAQPLTSINRKELDDLSQRLTRQAETFDKIQLQPTYGN